MRPLLPLQLLAIATGLFVAMCSERGPGGGGASDIGGRASAPAGPPMLGSPGAPVCSPWPAVSTAVSPRADDAGTSCAWTELAGVGVQMGQVSDVAAGVSGEVDLAILAGRNEMSVWHHDGRVWSQQDVQLDVGITRLWMSPSGALWSASRKALMPGQSGPNTAISVRRRQNGTWTNEPRSTYQMGSPGRSPAQMTIMCS